VPTRDDDGRLVDMASRKRTPSSPDRRVMTWDSTTVVRCEMSNFIILLLRVKPDFRTRSFRRRIGFGMERAEQTTIAVVSLSARLFPRVPNAWFGRNARRYAVHKNDVLRTIRVSGVKFRTIRGARTSIRPVTIGFGEKIS